MGLRGEDYSNGELTLFRQISTWALSSSGDPATRSLHTGHTVSSGRFLRLRLLAIYEVHADTYKLSSSIYKYSFKINNLFFHVNKV